MHDNVAKLFIQKLFQITDKRYFVKPALAFENPVEISISAKVTNTFFSFLKARCSLSDL